MLPLFRHFARKQRQLGSWRFEDVAWTVNLEQRERLRHVHSVSTTFEQSAYAQHDV
jgi:hypothetical protein